MPKRKDSAQALILVTGAAGFIGAFLCRCLLEEGDACVVGFDNVNDYYDVGIKEGRLRMLAEAAGGSPEDADVDGFSCGRFEFVRGDLADEAAAEALFERACPDVVVNLAAQAGVRYSIENPRAYVDSNLVGFFNVLEACRRHPVGHLVYASSSSVYGGNEKVPFSEEDRVDSPVSLYAATKKSNELMAHAYSKLYSIPATGRGSSLSTAPWAGPTWPTSGSPRSSCAASPSRSSTWATACATSPTSRTWWRPWRASWGTRPR